jgi:hypothetical protein
MTITNKTTYQILKSTNTKDPYPFDIEYISCKTIKITILKEDGSREDLIEEKDYRINKKYIEFLKKYPRENERILIQRKSSITQDVSFPPNVNFRESNIELMGDKIVLQNQEISSNLKRSIKIPIDVENFNTELPYPNPGMALCWNFDGTKLINSKISKGGGGKSDVPSPAEGDAGDLIRVNKYKNSYELFDLGLKQPNNGNSFQILRVSCDKKSYEFSDLPLFPKNEKENIGKIPILKTKNKFEYLKLSEKELIAVLEFEKEKIKCSSDTNSDLRYVKSNKSFDHFVGTRYELDFIYDKLDLKQEKTKIYAYITSVAFITNIPTFIYFDLKTNNFSEKYEDFSIKFEFEGKFKTRTNKSSKTIKANTSDFLILESDQTQLLMDEIIFDLKIKASIYRPIL